MNNRKSIVAPLIMAFLMVGICASAQNFQGLNTLQTIAQEGQNAGKYIVNIVFIFSGIVGALSLVLAYGKVVKGENAKDALANVGIGLITVFVILAIIKAVMAFS